MENSPGKAASTFPTVNSSHRGRSPTVASDIAVHVVDDDESIRFLMQTVLEANGLCVFAHASAEEFLAGFQPESAGCLVLDLQLPGIDGLELQEILIRKGIHIPIIFFTAQGSVSKAVTALKNGAVDFVEKPFDYKDLLRRIQKHLAFDAENRQRRHACDSVALRITSLTTREREVMEQIIAGRLNKHIAGELNICIKTVEFHRARIMEKMEVHSVAELVQLALGSKNGYAMPGRYVF